MPAELVAAAILTVVTAVLGARVLRARPAPVPVPVPVRIDRRSRQR